MSERWIAYEKNAAVHVAPAASFAGKNATLADGGKIPARRIWLDDVPPAARDAAACAALATALPLDALRAAAGTEDAPRELPDIAAAARPHLPAAAQDSDEAQLQLAILRVILSHPVHFRRRHPRIHAVDPAIVASALESVARKRQLQEQESALLQDLKNGGAPKEISDNMQALLYAPDKTSPAYRVLRQHTGGDPLAFARFFIARGLLADEHAYFMGEFAHLWPPQEDLPAPPPLSAPPPPAAADTFAIDDDGTKEIDDSFSAAPLPAGGWRIGIHIAVPALLLDAASDRSARRRLVSVYTPCAKHFMLPPAAVAACSLAVDAPRPALSLYLDVSAAGERIATRTCLESVVIAHAATPEQADAGQLPPAMQSVMQSIAAAEAALEAPAGAGGGAHAKIDITAMRLLPRARSGAARLIETLMRTANTHWAAQLAQSGAGCLYRQDGELKLAPPDPASSSAAPYAWFTSPLRRYVDLHNQRALLAALELAPPPQENRRALRREFDRQHTLSRRFQRALEIYWTMKIIQQTPDAVFEGAYIRKRRARIAGTPLVGLLPAAPRGIGEGDFLPVRVTQMDLLTQRATLARADIPPAAAPDAPPAASPSSSAP